VAPKRAAATAGMKICSAFALGGWRSITPALAEWELEDCNAFVKAIGGPMVQVGCLWNSDQGAGGEKFAWGDPAPTGTKPSAGLLPKPNCGW
jgi:hypothetical protein